MRKKSPRKTSAKEGDEEREKFSALLEKGGGATFLFLNRAMNYWGEKKIRKTKEYYKKTTFKRKNDGKTLSLIVQDESQKKEKSESLRGKNRVERALELLITHLEREGKDRKKSKKEGRPPALKKQGPDLLAKNDNQVESLKGHEQER